MNWLMKILFPEMSRGVRIRPDHLPGLKPPTAAPFTPKQEQPVDRTEENIRALYKRFRRTHPSTSKKRPNNDRGFDF
jgi:hypothetical protein